MTFLAVASAGTGTYNYLDQDAWSAIDAVCGNGTRQSPIDIVSADVIDNDELLDLVLEGWTEERNGSFYNTGTSVKFGPSLDESPLAQSPLQEITREPTKFCSFTSTGVEIMLKVRSMLLMMSQRLQRFISSTAW